MERFLAKNGLNQINKINKVRKIEIKSRTRRGDKI